MRVVDVLRLAVAGLRTRPLRVILSVLGIAIGIASMVAVVGISASSSAQLQQSLDRLGTNLLTVTAGSAITGGKTKLPTTAVSMVRTIPGVRTAAGTGAVEGLVYRTDRIPAAESNALTVNAADLSLLDTLGAVLDQGTWLNVATARYPAVVLGSVAASRLGIVDVRPALQVWLGRHWFTVIGVLQPVDLAPEINTSALIGFAAARDVLGFDGHPTTIYERSEDDAVPRIRGLLARTVNPQAPEQVLVSRPSDALAAKIAAKTAFTGLLLGIGSVTLLVGGIGVANIMVISVLERRGTIGLRRALGATRGHIRLQFLTESLLLSGIGGIVGAALGTVTTFGYSHWKGWPTDLPPTIIGLGMLMTIGVGILAGIYPAERAARTTPTTALTSI